MSDSPKRRLAESLSPQSKLLARQLFVRAVGACVRLAALGYRLGERVIGLAVAHGLDLRRAWDVAPAPRPFEPEPFGARDFLRLIEAADAGRRAPGPTAAGDADAGPGAAEVATDREARASVVVHAPGRVELTFQCLRSLLAEADGAGVEVIVVDDGSRDETARLLAHFAGAARVVRNDVSQGFAAACNRGAAEARGRHLVFLCGDAVVRPGWLRHLVETAEAEEGVGAVGSLSLDAGGRILEAGAVVWRDGAPQPYGRGRSPEDRRYAFAREADYCSGASLLVRRDLFARLGGFDGGYSSERFRDADLCFGVRALGHKVVYQPASHLVRLEDPGAGGDAGEGGGEGENEGHAADRARFAEKWRDTLEREHAPRDPAAEERAADRRRGPSIFVFDDHVLTPDRDAGSARMLYILRALSRWSRPVFIYTSKQTPNHYEQMLWAAGVETAPVAEYSRLLKERRPAVAVLSRPHVADLLLKSLRSTSTEMKIVFDMVDAHFIRLEREAAVTGDERAAREALAYREVEARVARQSDVIWCASTEDRAVMTREAPGTSVAVIPTIHAPRPDPAPFDARRGLLFVGNFRHRPNEDAAHHLVRDIFPRLASLLPEAELLLVGDNASPEIRAYASERVRVLGYVPDLETLLGGCRVMVAPLRFGAGIKGKIGEALAAGLPVVTTAVGAESMGIDDGEQALIADGPAEFAEAAARVYLDRALWEHLSRRGREHAAAHFSPEVVGRIINDSLREALGAGGGAVARAV